jgi:hypothetical protein
MAEGSASGGRLNLDVVEFSAESFEAAEARVVDALKAQKFGILWRIDAKAVIKTKLDVRGG